jgi:cytochrome c oxidase subunit 2
MSSGESVPDESGSTLEAAFWSLVILVGLGAFLYDFLQVLLAGGHGGQPSGLIEGFKQPMFLIAILGGGITVALIAATVFRFAAGNRRIPSAPNVTRGRYMMSIFAIGLTFLMVTTMFMGASALAQTDEATAEEAANQLDVERQIDVDVTAGQWFWRYDVDGMNMTQGERVVVPSQTVVDLEITSADVVHSFAIQELGLKKDAMPGQVNQAWFLVDQVDGETTIEAGGEELAADSYTVTCAELCGKAHSQMTGTVYVVSPEDYEHWASTHNGTVPESFHAESGNGGGHDDGGH